MPAESEQVDAPAFDARVKRRCILFRIRRSPVADVISYLGWAIPLAVAIVGVSYVLLEQAVLQGHPLSSPHVIRTLFVTGTVAPALAWLLLTWAKKITIAEQKAQQELTLRNRELAARNAIGDAASQTLDLAQVLQTALEKMVDLMGVQVGEMRLREGNKLVLKAQCGIAADIDKEKCVPLGHCLCGKCAETGIAWTLNTVPATMSLANTRCARQGFRSVVSVPMKTKGEVVGVVLLASRKAHAVAERDLDMLTAIGQRVAAAVENARLYQELARRATLLETASLIGQRMSALLDLGPLMAEIVKLIRSKFGYYHAHIFLVDEQARQVVLREASGPSADLIKAREVRLKIGEEGITGWVAHTGQTLMCNDVRREPRYCAVELLPETRAELAVPLRVGTRIIGVLDVQSDRLDTFQKEDATVLQILGNQVGIAIENARLFQETKQRYEAMVALHEISLDVIAQLDTTELLEALLRRGVHLLRAQAATLFLYDRIEDRIYNAASHNTWHDWHDVVLRPGEGVIGQVVLTGQPLIVNDYRNWPGRSNAFAGTFHSRVVGVPLKWQDEVIGVIDILGDPECRPFNNNDIWLLSHFADLATIALKNAELHTQIKQFSHELENKVVERTQELSRAHDEIAVKAEQLRSLWTKTVYLQEQERARIAREMHDGVIQLITAARLELRATRLLAGENLPAPAEEKMAAARQVLGEIEGELRRAIYDLHPPILDAVGLAPAIEKYVTRFQEFSGIPTRFQITGFPRRLQSSMEIAIFRIVEESLHNIVTHAEATNASVSLDFGSDRLCIIVEDDGHGFSATLPVQSQSNSGLGLFGMQERIRNLNGHMEVESERGHGTRLIFQLPIGEAES